MGRQVKELGSPCSHFVCLWIHFLFFCLPFRAKKKSKPLNLKIHSSVGSCENIPSQQRSPLLSERSLRSFFVGHAPFLPSTPPVHTEANFSASKSARPHLGCCTCRRLPQVHALFSFSCENACETLTGRLVPAPLTCASTAPLDGFRERGVQLALRRLTGSCHWSRIPTVFACRCTEGRGKQACTRRRMQGNSLFSPWLLSCPVTGLFLVAVDKASVIKFCNFFPPLRSTHVTFASQRCMWVQAGLSVAWGGLHSAPTNFCQRQSGYYSEWK